MISILLITVFIVGYAAIAFEHNLHLDKAASALITGVLCWLIYFLQADDPDHTTDELLHHLGEIASILFFLLGAMTIVALIDSYGGFDLLTQKITTANKSKLLIIISLVTFFLSPLLDNLTTAIVMTSLCSKLLEDKEDRLWFAGMIVIAANAGGAWSPMGDVTTTMLWIGGQITAANIIVQTIVPSIIVCAIPLLILVRRFRGKEILRPAEMKNDVDRGGNVVLVSAMALLIFIPVFKTLTNMPPFMGMLLALGIMWIITTVIHFNKPENEKRKLTVAHALQKIDTPSILFFLGILLAVSAFQSFGLLKTLAGFLDNTLKHDYLIGVVLGILSSIVDNVPLVAAAQGMYDLSRFPTDTVFGHFLH